MYELSEGFDEVKRTLLPKIHQVNQKFVSQICQDTPVPLLVAVVAGADERSPKYLRLRWGPCSVEFGRFR